MMGRRPFLKGASAMAMWRPRGDAPKPGTGGLPQRVDQQYDPPGPLVAPGGHAPNRFIGRVYISGPSGVLLSYSPTIAAGNLVASTGAAVGGTDHGNLYLAGDATYFNTGSGFLAVQIWAGQIFFQTATTEAGPWSQVGILEMAGPTGPMQLTSNAGNLELRGAAVNAVSPFQATSGTASQFSAAIDILAGGLSVIGGTVTDTLEVSGATDLDGALDVAGLSTVNGQLNVLTLPVNIEAMATPTTPGSGTKLFAPNSGGLQGHLLTIGTDGNTWATETLTFITQNQAISSTSPAALTGISVPLILGTTYKIKAMIPYSSTSVAGTAVFNFVLSGTATIASGFASAIFGVPGAAVTMTFRNTTATGSITSPVLASGQSVMWLEAIMGIGTANGTLTFTAQEGTNLDTFSIVAGGYFSISPVA